MTNLLMTKRDTAITKAHLVLAAALMAVTATPALAASDCTTRLVRCGGEDCLQVSGHRESVASQVKINGHPVAVRGGRSWRAKVPVSSVREWSAPFARTVEVTLEGDSLEVASSATARLPIGLLGHADLASLEISMQ